MANNAVLQAKTAQKRDIEDFFELHYPDNGHRGMIHLWAKSRYKNQKMYRLAYGEPEQLLEKISSSKIISAHQDYYLTANTMSAGSRDRDGLFSLNNVVIDLDNHTPGQDSRTTRHQYGAIIDIYHDMLMDGSGRYVPNTIVFTGRGMQLWFAIEQIGYKRLDVWERIADEIIRQTNTLLIDNKDILQGLSLDAGASKNAAGLFRAPWSFNRKSGTYAEFEIMHDSPIDSMDAVQELRRADRSSRVITFATATNGAALRRHNSLVRLLKLRQDQGQTIERDNFLFCVYCLWSGVYQDNAEVMARVKAVNALFAVPLPDKELTKAMSTAGRKRYTMKNATVIDRLRITTEEQEQCELFAKGSDREHTREAARKRKADRNKRILSMYAAGSTQQEIADSLSISRRTVCNVLEQAGARKSDARTAPNSPVNEKDDKKVTDISKRENSPISVRREGQKTPPDKMCKNRLIYGGNNAPSFLGAGNKDRAAGQDHARIIDYPPTLDRDHPDSQGSQGDPPPPG